MSSELEVHTKKINSPPGDTFRRHHPGWKGALTEVQKAEHENELYDAWLKSLKPGDVVYYRYWKGYSGGTTFTTVKSTTKTGMIRLEDGKLVDSSGRVKGESHCLQPYTEEYRTHDQRKKLLYKLNGMKFDHFTNEGLSLVMDAIMRAEGMLPKMIEGGQADESKR